MRYSRKEHFSYGKCQPIQKYKKTNPWTQKTAESALEWQWNHAFTQRSTSTIAQIYCYRIEWQKHGSGESFFDDIRGTKKSDFSHGQAAAVRDLLKLTHPRICISIVYNLL